MIIFSSHVAPKGLVLGYQVLDKREVQVINNRPHVIFLDEIIALSSTKEPRMSTKMIVFAQKVLQTPVFPPIFTFLTHLTESITILLS